ncbi:MAG: acylphosphatase [Anaerolineales bacterium]|nr:acylphosphatase [Chloroflexota bacterium]MBL6980321.1 acylphosphatase [Anaerolineales bacterium]
MIAVKAVRLRAQVEGRVQGVGFRYFVLDNAQPLDITGWVRNRWDGTVEVLAEGTKDSLETLLAAIQRGPRRHTTTEVRYDWLAATGEFTSFRIRRTE